MHFSSLNVCNFGMIEDEGFKCKASGHLQWHDLHTEFHKNLLIGSKVIREDIHMEVIS
jgi:hypothetical protein